jgi:hypothetical protein
VEEVNLERDDVDVYAVADFLRTFLSNLPECIFTEELLDPFLAVYSTQYIPTFD